MKKKPVPHLISVKDLNIKKIFTIFHIVDQIKKLTLEKSPFKGFLFGKVFATLFYEPSTRTRLSFESAINRLGGRVISVENAKENSSAHKGETLKDTIKTVSNYADCIVLRHGSDDSSLVASKNSFVPVINAGAGKHEHPTQALLDAYTIYEKFGRLDSLKMTIVGDLFRGRTVYSLVYLLSKFPKNNFTFVSTKNSKVNPQLKKYLKKHKIKFSESENLKMNVKDTDILYVTRIQRERCKDEEEYKQAKEGMIVNKEILKQLNKYAVIMHPLPRVDEITEEVDKDPRAHYFKQVENGVYLRMGLLINLFSGPRK
jgi:aspartate carbamoyltransferase catalytic subunit